MAEIRHNDTAVYDRVIAEKTIRRYFEEKQSPKLADKHVQIFLNELERFTKFARR